MIPQLAPLTALLAQTKPCFCLVASLLYQNVLCTYQSHMPINKNSNYSQHTSQLFVSYYGLLCPFSRAFFIPPLKQQLGRSVAHVVFIIRKWSSNGNITVPQIGPFQHAEKGWGAFARFMVHENLSLQILLHVS